MSSRYLKADWSLIPEHIRPGLQRYIETGLLPGDCLRAILANNLRDAIERADPIVHAGLGNILLFLVTYVPRECWGAPSKLTFWCGEGGLEGRAATKSHLQLVADNG